MIDPFIENLLKENNLGIDDVRWHLSVVKARSLSEQVKDHAELSYTIWSGSLADSLYDMEERFLSDLAKNFHERSIDEAGVRSKILEIKASQRRRPKNKDLLR